MEDTEDVSSLINVGRFLESFAFTLAATIYPDLDEEELALAATSCGLVTLSSSFVLLLLSLTIALLT